LRSSGGETAFRFSAIEEKVLWGDVADLLHLIYVFSPADDPVRKTLAEHHFDAIYLDGRKLGFISEEFRTEIAGDLEGEVSADAEVSRSDCGNTDGDSVGAFFE